MSEIKTEKKGTANASLLIRGAIWIAIGALIAAALVCVIWVLIGDQNGIIGRAFLTILLLAGFAGIAILEAGLATKRPDWLALASMITWIIALIVGAIKIWMPEHEDEYGGGALRFFQLLLVVGILQLALLHVRLFTAAARRYVTTFTTVIYYVTIGILVLLVGMLVFYLTLPDTLDYDDIYWRIVVALAILAAVGTTLIPLLNALFAPKKPGAAVGVPGGYAPQAYPSPPAVQAPATQQWPTYADGVTPLPVMHDGSPDWNAYYTGFPTQQQYAPGYGQLPAAPSESAASAPGGQTPLVSSPDAPIGPDGSVMPPAGAPPAPDGIPGVPLQQHESFVPPTSRSQWDPHTQPEAHTQSDAHTQSAPHTHAEPHVPPVPSAPPASDAAAPADESVPPIPPVPSVPPVPSAPATPEAEPPAPETHQQQNPPAPGAFPPPPPAPPR